MICRAVFTLSDLSVEDGAFLATNPSEIPVWLNIVQRVEPVATSISGTPSEKPTVWKTREGFPYG
jgi:hypothetical protein